jgi:hypothetical protein
MNKYRIVFFGNSGLICYGTLFLILIAQITFAFTVAPRYEPGIESIVHSHQYIQNHVAPVYWKISPYYIAQRNNSSCSLAIATMVVNAMRGNRLLYANDPLATQDKLLQMVNDKPWIEGVKPDGIGVTLEQLYALLPKVFRAYGLKNFSIEIVHVDSESSQIKKRLNQDLVESEETGLTFIIANFNQKFISKTMDVGHFAPVGAYDSKTQRVLLMDPDREFFEPYWVPENLFLQSLATWDNDAKNYRGYLVIRFKS